MSQLRRVGVLSAAKVTGMLYFILAIIVAGCMFLVSMAIPASAGMGRSSLWGMGFGAGMLIALPLIYGFFGFVFGAISAFIYNLVAGWVGGLELELD